MEYHCAIYVSHSGADLRHDKVGVHVAFGWIVSGKIPISAIPKMAGLPSLKFARAASASAGGG